MAAGGADTALRSCRLEVLAATDACRRVQEQCAVGVVKKMKINEKFQDGQFTSRH